MNVLRRAAAALPAVLILMAGCGRDGGDSAAPPAPAAPKLEAVVVRKGDVSRHIVLPAELAAWREVTLYAKVAGYLKEWKAMPGGRSLDIGDEVPKIDGPDGVLAVLSVPELEAEVTQLRAEVAKADADVRKAQADRESASAAVQEPQKERLSGDALVEKAVSAVRAAQADVAKYQADLNLAQTTYDRYQGLVAEKTVTALEFDQVRTKRESAVADLKAAESRLAALRDEEKYVRARLAELDARVAGAKARFAAAEAGITVAEAGRTVAQAKLNHMETMADYRFIRAPFPGRVVRRYVDPGAMIQAATATQTQASPLLTLSDQSKLRVLADVPETEVPHLSDSTKGRLTFPELPGRVVEVAVSRSSESIRPTTRTQRVELDIAEPKPPLRPGLYGQLRLTMETHAGVIVVPTAAVGGKGAERFVFLLAGGKAVKRAVALGFQEGDLTEIRPAEREGDKIVRGLADGETVLKLTAAAVLQNGQAVDATTVKY